MTINDDVGMHVGDVGTVVQLVIRENGVPVNVSSATTKEIEFLKADGTSVTKTASFLTDGSDGIITYTIESGVLSVAGDWQMQAHVVIGTWNGYSEVVEFEVFASL